MANCRNIFTMMLQSTMHILEWTHSAHIAHALLMHAAPRLKVGFHYPSCRPVYTGRVHGRPVTPVYTARVHRRPVSTTRVDGPSWRVSKNAPKFSSRVHGRPVTPVYTARVYRRPVSTTRVDGPSWRVSKNAPKFSDRQLGPWTRAVNSGSRNRPSESIISKWCESSRGISSIRLSICSHYDENLYSQ